MLCFRITPTRAATLGSHTKASNGLSQHLFLEWGPIRIVNFRNDRLLSSIAIPGNRRKWTEEEEKTIVELRKSGVKWSQMKFYFDGRTTMGIAARFNEIAARKGRLAEEARSLKKTKQKRAPIVKDDVEAVMRWHRSGLTAAEIDEKLGKNYGAGRIQYIVRESARLLNSEQSMRFTPEEDALLARLVSTGSRWSEIAKKFPAKSRRALQTRWHFALQTKESSDRSDDGPGPYAKTWSREELETMLEMYKQGKTNKVIADALGCADRQVIWKLNRLGLGQYNSAAAQELLNNLPSIDSGPLRYSTREETEKIREMARSGMKVSDIARAMTKSTAMIRYWMRKEYGHGPHNAWSREEEMKLKRLLDAGWNAEAISEKFGRTKASINSKAYKMRVWGMQRSATSNHHQHWTAEEEARVAEMLAQGKKAQNIGKELGRTAIAVRAKIMTDRRLGKEWTKRTIPRSKATDKP